MDIKATLTKQIGPFPVYAYVGGAVVLVGAYLYFRSHTGSLATPAPQTNYPTDNSLPYPYPGGGETGPIPNVPPTSPFSTAGPSADSSATTAAITGSGAEAPSGSTVGTGSLSTQVASTATPLPTPTANFVPTAPVSTTSQDFAAATGVGSGGPLVGFVAGGPTDVPAIAAMAQNPKLYPGLKPGAARAQLELNPPAESNNPVGAGVKAFGMNLSQAVQRAAAAAKLIHYKPPPPSKPVKYRAPTQVNAGRSGGKFV